MGNHMTVDDVLEALSESFPVFAKAAGSWTLVFHTALKSHEGDKLRDAHVAVLTKFKPSGRTPFPVPVEYLAELPNLRRDTRTASTQALDLIGHADRKRRLLDDWNERQGRRLSRGVPRVLQALLWRAEELAAMAAWKENPGPIVLGAEEIRLCLHRAISGERRERHGPIRASTPAALWWQQVTDVAHGWGIAANWDDWQGRARADDVSPQAPQQDGTWTRDSFDVSEPV